MTYYSLDTSGEGTLPFHALYVEGGLNTDQLIPENGETTVQFSSRNLLREEVQIPVTVSVAAPAGVSHASVSADGQLVFEAASDVGNLTLDVGEHEADMLFARYPVSVTLAEPSDSSKYRLVSTPEDGHQVGYLTDGICDRIQPVRSAVLEEITEAYFGEPECHKVTAASLATVSGGIIMRDEEGSTFSSDSLTGLVNVKNILLTADESTSLERGFLSGATKLEDIEVGELDDDGVAVGAFGGVATLKYIGVFGTFNAVPDNVFNGVSSLESIVYQSKNVDTIDVPLSLVKHGESEESADDQWADYQVMVPTAAPFDMTVVAVARQEGELDRLVRFGISAGNRLSGLERVTGDPDQVDVILKNWMSDRRVMMDGFTFRTPHYMEMMDADDIDDTDLPVAAVAFSSFSETGFPRFVVSLSDRVTEPTRVRYEVGVFSGVGGTDPTFHGAGFVIIPVGEYGAELPIVAAVPDTGSYEIVVTLPAAMDSEGYTVAEELKSASATVAASSN